jgi:hypothetical protein
MRPPLNPLLHVGSLAWCAMSVCQAMLTARYGIAKGRETTCAVQRRCFFPVGERPARLPLPPEAIGAVMEATKWLEPLM